MITNYEYKDYSVFLLPETQDDIACDWRTYKITGPNTFKTFNFPNDCNDFECKRRIHEIIDQIERDKMPISMFGRSELEIYKALEFYDCCKRMIVEPKKSTLDEAKEYIRNCGLTPFPSDSNKIFDVCRNHFRMIEDLIKYIEKNK